MTVPRADIEDIYPLSPLQQGVLFHAVLDPEAGDYVVQLSAALSPLIAPHVFRSAWQMMVDRCVLLRTLFVTDAPEGPLQVVVRRAELPWTELDWRDASGPLQQRRLEIMLATDRRRGFVLTEPPLLRITAIRMTEARWSIVLSFHHILWDGWSLGQLMQEVGWCCEALTNGRQPDLPQRRPFRDYVEWLRRKQVDTAMAFWKDELAGVRPLPSLSAHRAATAAGPSSYGQRSLRFSEASHRALVDFARRSKLTVNTLVQGAWAILLSRYTSCADVVFGATVAGRPADLAHAEAMFGLFLNTLPVRITVDEDAVLEDWLAAIQARQLRAREHDFCQLADIQRMASYGAGAQPLFETILDVKSFPLRNDPGKTSWALFEGPVATFEQSGYPLTMTASAQPHLVIDADFNQSRFDAEWIARLLAQLQRLLEDMPRGGGRPVSEIRLLPVGEEAAIEQWSTGSAASLRTTSFQEDVERRAAAAPDAIAVVTDAEQLTYEALNRRANQLARHLRDHGLGPEACVGVCLERSADLVVALVALLKIGAVYVPLDPGHPRVRLAGCARDARLEAMLVTVRTEAAAPPISGSLVNLDHDRDRIASRDASNVVPAALGPRQLAYVIFTSGSTGVPKGAMVEMLGFLNHLDVMIATLGMTASDVMAQTAGVGFDISIWQLAAPLVAGATVRIYDDATALDAAALVDAINRDGVTVVEVVPAMLRLMLNAPADATRRSLRSLIVTGEAVAPELASRWLAQHAGIALLNAYGPAECADDVTLGVVDELTLRNASATPIGRPVANVSVHVLDERMRPVPIGAAGELYIGGQCVGRGYAHDPGRTAAVFVPDPWSGRPGDRLYRTGDLGKWLPDGTLTFLGRVDLQVKLHGARIEISEIEAVIQEHSFVDQVAVTCGDRKGVRSLAAFIVPAAICGDRRDDVVSRLRDHMGARLPRYMIPGVVTLVERLPLNANGKIDRSQLHAPDAGAIRAASRSLTAAEEVMAAIWSRALDTTSIPADAEFFELGGHSLIAMQVVATAARVFDSAIPLRALFENPQLDRFTLAVERLRAGWREDATPLEAVARGGPLPVSSSQQRMWELIVSWPHRTMYTMPLAFRLRGALDIAAMAQSFADLVARHETLRTTVRTMDGRLVQDIDEAEPSFALPVVDLSRYASDVEALARQVAAEEAARGFNPVEEHGMRAAVLALGPDDHVLLITVNHLVADDASIGILLADLATAYASRSAGVAPSLPPLRLQFADYVCWLDRWLGTAEGQRQQRYWQRTLSPPLPRLALTTTPRSTSGTGARFRRVRHRVAVDALTGLTETARVHGVSLFTAVLAAFKLFLFRRTGVTDIAVATMVSTRDGAELQKVIGPLLTTQILRTSLDGNCRLVDLFARVQRAAVEALSNRAVPIDRAVGGNNDAARSVAAVQTLLLFQRIADEAFAIGDLEARPFAMQPGEGDEVELTSYDVICEIEARRQSLDVIFRYNADLFSDAEAHAMLAGFDEMLTFVAGDPRREIQPRSEPARDER